MNKLVRLICLAICLLGLSSAASVGSAATTGSAATDYAIGDTFSLTIMHTHDIHGNLDDISRYANYVDDVQRSVDNMLLLDGGDMFRRGELEQFRGIMEAEIFNLMGYDACVTGNHEFNVPADEKDADDCNAMISDLAQALDAPLLCANVTMKATGEYMEGVEPYTIVELDGVRIGIIGLTSMKPAEREMPEVADKDFLDAMDTLNRCIAELEGRTDINIVLSHAGIVQDLALMELGHTPDWSGYSYDIAAILSADTHLMMPWPLFCYYGTDKGIPVFQHGGEQYNTLARLDLEFEVTAEGFKLVDHEGYVCDVSETEPDPAIDALIAEYRAEAEAEAAA